MPPLGRSQRRCEEMSPMFSTGPPGCQQGTNMALQEPWKSGETWGAEKVFHLSWTHGEVGGC